MKREREKKKKNPAGRNGGPDGASGSEMDRPIGRANRQMFMGHYLQAL